LASLLQLGVFDPSKKKKKKKVRIAEEGDTEGVTEKMDNLNGETETRLQVACQLLNQTYR
jgi:hypothetical protein